MGAAIMPMLKPAPPSSILAVAAEVRARRARGLKTLDLSVGDFGADHRAPLPLLEASIRALCSGQTRYPMPVGQPELREAVADLYAEEQGWRPSPESVLVATGARPLLFATYSAAFASEEAQHQVVLDPVPSWSTDAYARLAGARRIALPTGADSGFLLRAEMLDPVLARARVLSLCSPSNPAGTTFTEEDLGAICVRLHDENRARARRGDQPPVILLWDQVYWQTTAGDRCVHPLALVPELASCTVVVDGISKAVAAATGLRVGFGVAPPGLHQQMRDLLDHAGTWAPTPFQAGVAALLRDRAALDLARSELKADLQSRRMMVIEQLRALGARGLPIEVLAPEGGFYVAARLAWRGESDEQARRRLLERGGLAAVPFSAFGLASSGWFRLAVAAPSLSELASLGGHLHRAFDEAPPHG
jgi:aspartate aminotransferase